MVRAGTVFFFLAGLASSAPTKGNRIPPQTKTPDWSARLPGPWRSPYDGVPTDVPPEILLQEIAANYTRATRERIQSLNSNCTEENALRRKEWGSLPAEERLEYLSAVECLAALPPHTTADFAPGAKTRWDDFVVAHILNTRDIHWSAWLLPWHRHFIWTMEQALRNECGYKGALPYWDWPKYADVPLSQNPVFDDSPTSFSGNGVTVAPNCTVITSGPLAKANWTVQLGPVAQMGPYCKANPQVDGLGYNPRPLERWIREPHISMFQGTNSYQNVTDVILHYDDPVHLNLRVDNLTTGIHGPPHIFIGGLNSDTYSSPGDPVFFLHHAMLDRVWSYWQSYDFDVRESNVGFTTGFDIPIRKAVFGWGPAPYVDLDSTLYLSPFFENTTARESMSTLKGQYCYIYE